MRYAGSATLEHAESAHAGCSSGVAVNKTGADGATYGFYSMATDNVGNRQAVPAAAHAPTKVSAGGKIFLPPVRRQ